MKFSVLLPLYEFDDVNHFNLCLTSILHNQSTLPNQIVIVKDGFIPLEIINLLNHFCKKYVNLIDIVGYEQNKGLGYALTYGIKYCKHEIVFRMDSDDICSDHRFSTQLKYFKENNNLAIIGGDIEEFLNTPNDIGIFRKVPYTLSEINKVKFYRNPFNHMTVAFRKSIVLKTGGYLDMPGYEDYYLWLRILSKGYDCLNLNQVLVHARVGNNMIGRRQGISFFKKEFKFQKTILNDGLIDINHFIFNMITRGLSRLLPVAILQIIYTKILRN
jgi:glycosyltransferase involved in cell wall biosynthesis